MIVGAIDLSLTKMGVARSNGDGRPWSSVLYPRGRGAARLEHGLKLAVSAMRGCAVVVLEGPSFASEFSQAHSTGEMHGVVKVGLWQMRPRPVIATVPPTSLKLFACNHGHADKERMMKAARKLLGWKGTRDDEADARWLLQMALHAYGLPGTIPMHERAAQAVAGADFPPLP